MIQNVNVPMIVRLSRRKSSWRGTSGPPCGGFASLYFGSWTLAPLILRSCRAPRCRDLIQIVSIEANDVLFGRAATDVPRTSIQDPALPPMSSSGGADCNRRAPLPCLRGGRRRGKHVDISRVMKIGLYYRELLKLLRSRRYSTICSTPDKPSRTRLQW